MVCGPQQEGNILQQASNLNILIGKAECMIVEAGHIRDDDIAQDSDSDASDCSKSNNLEDILKDISSYTSCLMELAPTMLNTLNYVLSKHQ